MADSSSSSSSASASASASASYIRVVQHLIERCLLFYMSREECMEALSKHANIKPVITSTVWKELEKENKEFFEAYQRSKEDHTMGDEKREMMIQKSLSDSSSNNNNTRDSKD